MLISSNITNCWIQFWFYFVREIPLKSEKFHLNEFQIKFLHQVHFKLNCHWHFFPSLTFNAIYLLYTKYTSWKTLDRVKSISFSDFITPVPFTICCLFNHHDFFFILSASLFSTLQCVLRISFFSMEEQNFFSVYCRAQSLTWNPIFFFI